MTNLSNNLNYSHNQNFLRFVENYNRTSYLPDSHHYHPDSYSRFIDDVRKDIATSVDIQYSNKDLPVATVKLSNGHEYNVTLPANVSKTNELFQDKNVSVSYSMKDMGIKESAGRMLRVLYEESLAPLIALGSIAGIYFGFKNSFDQFQRQIGLNQVLKQAPDQVLSEDKIKGILNGLDDATAAQVKSAREMLLNHRQYGQSKIIFMEGPPATGKTFLADTVLSLGHKIEKAKGIFRINLGPDNTDKIISMIQDLKNGQNAQAVVKTLDKKLGKPTELIQLMVDEITNPHFASLQQSETVKDIIQSEFKIKTTTRTPLTYATMAVVALAGLLGLKTFYDSAKRKLAQTKQTIFTTDNLVKMAGIALASTAGVVLASRLFRKVDIRKLKMVIMPTGNNTPKAWGNLDDVVGNPLARRIVKLKIDKINPKILTDNFSKTLKKTFPQHASKADDISKAVVEKYKDHLNYSTLQDGYFLEFLKQQHAKLKDLPKALEATIEKLIVKSGKAASEGGGMVF